MKNIKLKHIISFSSIVALPTVVVSCGTQQKEPQLSDGFKVIKKFDSNYVVSYNDKNHHIEIDVPNNFHYEDLALSTLHNIQDYLNDLKNGKNIDGNKISSFSIKYGDANVTYSMSSDFSKIKNAIQKLEIKPYSQKKLFNKIDISLFPSIYQDPKIFKELSINLQKIYSNNKINLSTPEWNKFLEELHEISTEKFGVIESVHLDLINSSFRNFDSFDSLMAYLSVDFFNELKTQQTHDQNLAKYKKTQQDVQQALTSFNVNKVFNAISSSTNQHATTFLKNHKINTIDDLPISTKDKNHFKTNLNHFTSSKVSFVSSSLDGSKILFRLWMENTIVGISRSIDFEINGFQVDNTSDVKNIAQRLNNSFLQAKDDSWNILPSIIKKEITQNNNLINDNLLHLKKGDALIKSLSGATITYDKLTANDNTGTLFVFGKATIGADSAPFKITVNGFLSKNENFHFLQANFFDKETTYRLLKPTLNSNKISSIIPSFWGATSPEHVHLDDITFMDDALQALNRNPKLSTSPITKINHIWIIFGYDQKYNQNIQIFVDTNQGLISGTYLYDVKHKRVVINVKNIEKNKNIPHNCNATIVNGKKNNQNNYFYNKYNFSFLNIDNQLKLIISNPDDKNDRAVIEW